MLNNSPPCSVKAEYWSLHHSAPFHKQKCHKLELDKVAQKKFVVGSHSFTVHLLLGQDRSYQDSRGNVPLIWCLQGREHRLPGVASPPVSEPGGDKGLRRSFCLWARGRGWGVGEDMWTLKGSLSTEGHFLFGILICALEFWCGPIHAHGNHPAESWLQATMWTTLVPGTEPAQELPGGPESQSKSPFCFPKGFYPKFWEMNISDVKWEMIMRSIGTPGFDSKPDLQYWHPKPSVKVPWLILKHSWAEQLVLQLPKGWLSCWLTA